MAVAFDATANSGYHAVDGNYSWTHVVGSGNNQILVVSVALLNVANSVSTLTYNGVALTKLRADVSVSTTVRTEIWYLLAPAQGSHSVSITLNTANVSGATSTSYNNVDQSIPIDAQNGGTAITGAGGGSASIDTTTVAKNAWVVDAVATPDTAITVGSGQTERGNITGAIGSGGQSDEGPKATPGTVTMSWDNIAGLTTWTMSTMSLTPSIVASVSDSATITESLTRYSDQIDVNEQLVFLQISSVSKSDTVTIAESLSIINISSISLSDNLSLSEGVQLNVSDVVLNFSDTISLSESISIAYNNLSGTYDQITVSENINILVFQPNYYVSVSDSISGGLTTSASIIFLTDGRLAVRISNNIYMPL